MAYVAAIRTRRCSRFRLAPRWMIRAVTDPSADITDRVVLSGRIATRDVWVTPEWEGRSRFGPWLLPDGRDVVALVAGGDIDDVPFPVWFRPSNSGRRLGDLLWAGGLSTKLASQRFVDVLVRIGATGYRTYEITFVDRTRRPIEGYVGIASTGTDPDLDVSHVGGSQNSGLQVTRRVLDALLAAGVDGFDVLN